MTEAKLKTKCRKCKGKGLRKKRLRNGQLQYLCRQCGGSGATDKMLPATSTSTELTFEKFLKSFRRWQHDRA